MTPQFSWGTVKFHEPGSGSAHVQGDHEACVEFKDVQHVHRLTIVTEIAITVGLQKKATI